MYQGRMVAYDDTGAAAQQLQWKIPGAQDFVYLDSSFAVAHRDPTVEISQNNAIAFYSQNGVEVCMCVCLCVCVCVCVCLRAFVCVGRRGEGGKQFAVAHRDPTVEIGQNNAIAFYSQNGVEVRVCVCVHACVWARGRVSVCVGVWVWAVFVFVCVLCLCVWRGGGGGKFVFPTVEKTPNHAGLI